MSADESEVRSANEAFYRAFEALDLRGMEAAWSHGGAVSCVHPGWPLANGWSEVRETWRVIFENTADIRFDIEHLLVDVQGDLAWVVCTEQLRSRSAAGSDEGTVLATNVFRREDGVWKVAHHHGSPFVAPLRPRLPGGTRKGMVH